MNRHIRTSSQLLTQNPLLNLAVRLGEGEVCKIISLDRPASKMQAVFLSFVLCLCSLGKCQKRNCEKISIEEKRPANLDLSSLEPSYEHGQSVRLRCEPGYTGLQRANCNDGHWTVTGRKCQKKPCGHPGDTPNGDFELASGDDFVFGAVVQYMCKTGYRMMSRNSQRSCVASGWDNDVPVCEEVKCPIIQVADNVQASGNVEDGGYGDVIHFECQSPDLQLNGPGEIHCTDEGKWSGDIPTCKEIQCEKPDILHGSVIGTQPVFRKDDILRYTCDKRYKASVGPNPKCTKTGWTSTPECKEIRCRLDKASTGTTRIPDQSFYLPGQEVEIVCLDRYRTPTFKQKDSFLCGEDGNWPPGKTPDCEEIFCSRPQEWQVVFPRQNYSYRYKQTVSYRCAEKYKKVAEIATCGLEGWIPRTLCVNQYTCIPPTIENGFIVQHTLDNKVIVMFACTDGFKLNTGGWWKASQCYRGTWSLIPKCIDQNMCTARPEAEYVKYTEPAMEVYTNGKSQQFQCEPGYTSEIQSIHCVDGEWEKPVCSRDGNWCEAPPDEINAIIVQSHKKLYRDGVTVSYTCRESYKIEGEKNTITCNAGHWTNPPTCIPVCAAPANADDVTYMFVSKKEFYWPGEVLKIECKPGYRSELQQVQCHIKTWEDPNCTRDNKFCTTPPKIENGTIVSQEQEYPNGSEVKYRCDRFHKIVGKDTITCRLGNWNKPPSCIKQSCGKPNGKHMELNPDVVEYQDGATVRYTCKSPYTATPGGVLNCAKGQWNGIVECKVPIYSCVPPSNESFIQVIGNTDELFHHGTSVKFQCPLYYTFVEDQIVNTLENTCHYGEWTHQMTCWKPCTVTQKDMDDRNIVFKYPMEGLKYIRHNDRFTFECKQSTTKKPGSVGMGQKCINGKMELPECH